MTSPPIDLRSDTVTRPTPAMRAAIAEAPVGDDQFGEDPTVNELQARVATLLGKESALWMPSGTMANQVALRILTRSGDDVIVSRESHMVWAEAGAGAVNSGVQFTEIGSKGTFTAKDFLAARKPQGHPLTPPTTVVAIENTHNRSGGIVFPSDEVVRISAAARESGIATYLDGARLWNAAAASGHSLGELAAPFDVVSVALSKGLGAPGGSLLSGTREMMVRAVRVRRMFGGAMRQAGILAAGGLFALTHHLTRLTDDHANARRLATRLAASPHIVLDLSTVQTNIIMLRIAKGAANAAAIVERARQHGVLVLAFGERTIRAVTHLDVTPEQCDRAAEVLVAAVEETSVAQTEER
ncbi:MAG: aminotransferase class I/II-fold pyridoxal phosphate-dependent enzyme [Acidobacteria bacterium]|nr:aminotransferase class I/II-fold pyridoxal phosphate-dependent enzyme [Acidobacteriota bacterium]